MHGISFSNKSLTEVDKTVNEQSTRINISVEAILFSDSNQFVLTMVMRNDRVSDIRIDD